MAYTTEYDLCVIGGGAAGLVTAAGAAALGAKVILIERDKLGGDCLYTGCIPSKTLLHSAQVAYAVKRASRAGLSATLAPVDQQKVLERVTQVIQKIEPNDSPERFRKLGVEVLFSQAQFIDGNTLTAGERTITSRHFVIATGSRPLLPDIAGLDSVDFLTNETIFDLTETVKHLIVIGSGPIACELAQSYARLGAKVTIVSQSGLLPREDKDLSAVVKTQFESEQIELHLEVDVEQVIKTDTGLAVQFYHDEHDIVEGSHILVATGRLANIEGLGLEQAGVAFNAGHLVLDKRLRTTNKHIFACGDVAGPYLFTHMAEHQAGVVLRNTLFHLPTKAQTLGISWCTFTSPELARVGLSEYEVREQGKAHEVYCFPFAEIDRAITDDDTTGMAKVITSPRGKILGACIVGPNAGELIAEYSLAMSAGLSVSALSKTIHLYPSLAQINRRVADLRLKSSLTPFKQRLLKKLFGLRGGQ
ncbi:MAG: pyruvate/2-oxoglutarate dehydrogenase complex dihydrolipoamide dehydrogenase (E3) component [Methylophagaceae bacterium]|jgi:pyruvate/2-oxoglutarate dehydrogenase complex dihydrolipoamide dehydrogenase (E3) component